MTLTRVDHARRDEVILALHGAFITGSYLVDKNKANDIDIVVPWGGWKASRAGALTKEEDGAHYVAGVRFVKQDDEGKNGRYSDDENEQYELVEHWRAGGLNLLIIRENFIPAYKAASYYLESAPDRFRDRESRVEIHQRMKGIIRDMLTTAAEGYE